MTLPEIDRVLALLAATYPHSLLPPESEALWAQALESLPATGVWSRLQAYILNPDHRYPPLLADILVEPWTDQAEHAWLAVATAIQDVGSYRVPVWDDPACEQAIRACGGWAALCRSDNPAADRAHFLRYYTAYHRRTDRDQWTTFWQALHATNDAAALPVPGEATAVASRRNCSADEVSHA